MEASFNGRVIRSGVFTDATCRMLPEAELWTAVIQQAIQDEQADIFDPVERGVIRWEQLIEIGEILAGKKEGRTKPDQITFYKNNAGQGVADVALGALVLEEVQKKHAGETLDV